MTPAMRPDAYRPDDDTGYDRTSARLTVIGGAAAAPWAPGDPVRPTSARDLTPIVHLPFPPVAAPEPEPVPPQVVAEASLQVKRFHGGVADDERYTATLHAASNAPAALLAALADATTQIEDLVRVGAPDDYVILTIAIRR